MLHDIKESDWKLLKQLHPIVLERYCQQALGGIEYVRSNNACAFRQRYEAIVLVVEYKEREITQLFDGLHRRTALARLTALHERNLLTEEEFARFSYEARTAVEMRKSCLT